MEKLQKSKTSNIFMAASQNVCNYPRQVAEMCLSWAEHETGVCRKINCNSCYASWDHFLIKGSRGEKGASEHSVMESGNITYSAAVHSPHLLKFFMSVWNQLQCFFRLRNNSLSIICQSTTQVTRISLSILTFCVLLHCPTSWVSVYTTYIKLIQYHSNLGIKFYVILISNLYHTGV